MSEKSKIELLAPAGSPESVEAAVQGGADAVYLGYGDFNARRNAKNFSLEELAQAVDYCHLRGVSVFLTLNTLLRDRELPKVAEMLSQVIPLGIDAVIAQDLGVVDLLQQIAPNLPLHASTQCVVHSLEGVQQAQDLGFSRVVLARELSRQELEYIAGKSPLPLEVFVHGALCMSYSGQCYFSAMVGERSGNRGLCAQACRLEYSCDSAQKKGKKSHPLSLKDLSLGGYLQELQDMGIASLKIEGRMKRPEYVSVVTKIYSQALAQRRSPTPEEWQMLETAFSRQGFTQGYYHNKLGKAMFGMRENTPPPKDLFAQAKREYQGKEQRKTAVSFDFIIDDQVRLTLTDPQGRQITQTLPGHILEEARQKPLSPETVTAQLQRTGGTVYTLEPGNIQIPQGIAFPLAKLNQLRRDSLAELDKLRLQGQKYQGEIGRFHPLSFGGQQSKTDLQWTVSLFSPAQITDGLLQQNPALLYLPLSTPEAKVRQCQAQNIPLCVKLPAILSDQERGKLLPQLKQWQAWGVTEALVGSLDSYHWGKKLGFSLRGDYGLNQYNSHSLHKLGELKSALPSFELNLSQIRDLQKNIPLELLVYGNLPLMTMKNSMIPPQNSKEPAESYQLTDRKNISFPLEPGDFGRSELYNALPLYLADKDLSQLGLWAGRLFFTRETAQQCQEILLAYQQKQASTLPLTRGLYYRGVE